MAESKQGQEPFAIPVPSLRKISGKFTLAVALLLVLAMCLFWLVSSFNTRNLLRAQADGLGQTLVEMTAAQLTELVLANDLISMNVVLSSLVRDPMIQSITVRNVDNTVISSARSRTEPRRTLFALPLPAVSAVYRNPINLPDSVIGSVEISLDLAYIEMGTTRNLLLIIGTTLLLLLIAVVMTTTCYQYMVGFPAQLLSSALSNIRQGRIETFPEQESADEIGQAIRQYNATARFIAHNTFLGRLQNQQPQDTPEHSCEASSQLEMSLLIISMTNYQYLASTVEADRFLELMNRCYFFTDKVARLYNGSVSSCAEGEVIISFSEALTDQDQAFLSICAGQLFLQLAARINQVGDEPLQARFRLAVHSGRQLSRLYSPVTGTHNNLTGKVLDQLREIGYECPDNSLLISESVYLHAGAYSRVDADEFADIGDDELIRTYLVSTPLSDYRQLLEQQAMRLGALYPG